MKEKKTKSFAFIPFFSPLGTHIKVAGGTLISYAPLPRLLDAVSIVDKKIASGMAMEDETSALEKNNDRD